MLNKIGDDLNPTHLELLYKKIKSTQSPSIVKKLYMEVEVARNKFENHGDSLNLSEDVQKQLRKFFAVWESKKENFKQKNEDMVYSEGEDNHRIEEARTGIQSWGSQKFVADDDWLEEMRIKEKDVIEEIKAEKMLVIQKLNLVKDLQLKESELHSMHTERLQTIDDLLGDTLKKQQSANKELQSAYLTSTKSTTTNLKTGMITTGGVLGTFGLPGLGTIGGALTGWFVGKKVENSIVNKTKKNFEKMDRD